MSQEILLIIVGGLVSTLLAHFGWVVRQQTKSTKERLDALYEKVEELQVEVKLLQAEKTDEEKVRKITAEIIHPLTKNVEDMRVTSDAILKEVHKMAILLAKKFPED